MKTNKKGISLIVLVITIIVMIILASAIILSLDNTGIMDRAEQAVDASDIKQVQTYASTVWAEAYLDGARTKADLKTAVLDGLKDIDTSNYLIIVTQKGVDIFEASKTLGGLVKSGADYGKTVNYTANGVNDWKVFYKQEVDGEEYVYLISSKKISTSLIPTNIPNTTVSYDGIYYSGEEGDTTYVAANVQNSALWMDNWTNKIDMNTADNIHKYATYFLDETYWLDFKNTERYGSNVVGAVGVSTLEMFVASLTENGKPYFNNAFRPITIAWASTHYTYKADTGYINTFYATSDHVWLASPVVAQYNAGDNTLGLAASCTGVSWRNISNACGVRPVVCLKSSTPAHAGTGTETNIVLD